MIGNQIDDHIKERIPYKFLRVVLRKSGVKLLCSTEWRETVFGSSFRNEKWNNYRNEKSDNYRNEKSNNYRNEKSNNYRIEKSGARDIGVPSYDCRACMAFEF